MFPRKMFYVTTILWKKILKSHLRWKLLPGSSLLENLLGKTTTPKKEKTTNKATNYS